MTLTESWLAAIDGTNALASTVEFSRHGLIQHLDPVDAARVVFEDADPVREFPSWPGKRNFEGKLWMASTGRHVPFDPAYRLGAQNNWAKFAWNLNYTTIIT